MTHPYYQQPYRPSMEFLILMGLWLACFVAGSLATLPIWMVMTGKSFLTMGEDMKNPAYINALKTVQVVSTVLIFFLPAYITARIVSQQPLRHLGFVGGVKWDRAFMAVLIMLSALPLVAFLADVNKAIPITAGMKKLFDSLESQYLEQVKMMATFRSPADYVVALVVIAFFPALVEEVFFRGGLQAIFTRWYGNAWLAIIVTSVIFSAIHFSWYGLIPRITLGIVLGALFYYSGNLWYSIIGHFFNNALMVTVLYAQYLKNKKVDLEVGESAPWWAGVLGAVALIALLLVFRRKLATKVYADSIAASTGDAPKKFV